MKKPKMKKLKNGLRLMLVPMDEQQTGTVLVLVEAGSKYETKQENGISHFLEHMCFKGTTRRPTAEVIANEIDSMGAEFNAFTGHEYTGYYAKVAKHHLARALDLVADLFVNPTFKQEDINIEKGAIIGEIDMRNDMLPGKTGELFMKLLYGDQPAGWPIAGEKKKIPEFTRDDFISYRKKHYVPSATIVVVAGKFDEQQVYRDVKKYFEQIPSATKKSKKKVDDHERDTHVLVEQKESDQSHIVIGVRGVGVKHKDLPVFAVLGALLGGGMSSRLFLKLRGELGIGYYAHASHDAFTDHGVFAAAAGVDHKRIGEAVSAICNEFSKVTKQEPDEAELKKVKDMIAGRMLLGLESSDKITKYYNSQKVIGRPPMTPDEKMKQIMAVTGRDIVRVAKKYFTTERLYLAMIGPAQNPQQLQGVLKI
jgi:predicted Zn-dependent peptidase